MKKTILRQIGQNPFALGGMLIILACLLTFFPTLNNGFVNWNDPVYVLNNVSITQLSWENLQLWFTQPVGEHYHPLTVLSLALNYQIGGFNPMPYHLTNLLLHIATSIFVYHLIFRLYPNYAVAMITAALFAIHPVHVEPIAWVSARKDVLFAAFYLPALYCYLENIENEKPKYLLYSLGFFLLALLSKPSAVTLALVFPLIDWGVKRPRTTRSVLEKIPFFALAVLFGIMTVLIQSDVAVRSIQELSLQDRLNFGSFAMLFYLVKFWVPTDLSVYHAYPDPKAIPDYFNFLPLLAATVVGGFYWLFRGRNQRLIWFGFLFFLFTISINLPFFFFGESIVADRYAYIPYIGLGFIAGLLVLRAGQQRAARQKAATLAITIYGILLCAMSFQQSRVWKDANSLWTSAMENALFKDAFLYSKRGEAYLQTQQDHQALIAFEKALTLDPEDTRALTQAGVILARQKKCEEALQKFDAALAIEPDRPGTYFSRALTWYDMDNPENALRDLDKAIELDGHHASFYQQRGIIHYAYGSDLNRAYEDFSQAIRLDPLDGETYFHRARVNQALGDIKAAVNDVKIARKLGHPVAPEFIAELKEKA